VAPGVTVEHLLSHTSGYQYKGNSDVEHGANRTEVLKALFKNPPKTAPGTKFLYNNAAYSLIEDLASKASGKPWLEIFQETMIRVPKAPWRILTATT
jgi:CubicO group peptidase (beta-lactamase class C family)